MFQMLGEIAYMPNFENVYVSTHDLIGYLPPDLTDFLRGSQCTFDVKVPSVCAIFLSQNLSKKSNET